MPISATASAKSGACRSKNGGGAPVNSAARNRLADAIRRRVFPNTRLHLPQLAGAIGCPDNTFGRWYRGESKMSLDALDALQNFFSSRGDWGFIAEVFGIAETLERQIAERHEIARQDATHDNEMAELRERLARLEARFAQLDEAPGAVAALASGSIPPTLDVAGRQGGGAGPAVAAVAPRAAGGRR